MDARLRSGLLESVEVHDHHIDRQDAVFFDLGAMLPVVALVKDTAVDVGVKSLDAPIQHLRKSSEVGDVADLKAGVAQRPGGAPGGNQFHSMAGKALGEFHQAGLIGDAQQGAGNFLFTGRGIFTTQGMSPDVPRRAGV